MTFPRLRWRSLSASRFCLIAGILALAFGALLHVTSRSLFDPDVFGERAAQSLIDPGVAAFVSDSVASAIVRGKPDLVSVRPLILAAAQGLLSTRPFQVLAGAAASRAHRAAFSEGARRLLVSLPDFHVLLREALGQASPELAAKLPRQLESAIHLLDDSRWAQSLVSAWAVGRHLRASWEILLPLGALLLVFGVWVAPHHRRALARCGFGLTAAALFLAVLVPAGSLFAAFHPDPLQSGLLRGLWRTFFGELYGWALFLGGIGILLAAGAASLLEAVDPVRHVRRYSRYLIEPPSSPGRRAAWGSGLFLAGLLAIAAPGAVLQSLVVLAGACAAYLGVRELFRVFLERVAHLPPEARQEEIPGTRSWLFAAAGVFTLVGLLAAGWALWRNPFSRKAQAATLVCNGHAELCSRTLDQVSFAAAHNAMSNQSIPDWMFPHHEKSIPAQLRDGVRALLIDVHPGFPGGARIKTDMAGEPMAAKLRVAIGEQGYQAALRIRNQLVGVDEGARGLYLCHGVCELGAYPLVPALRDIRDFLVAHPDEVILIVIEDSAQPREIEQAFQQSGLAALVYRGRPSPHWPTLKELIAGNQRVVVFLESGRPGVDWLRPAFEAMMETPYSFHKPEEFSCRPNRGPGQAPLFLLNHWIETTPMPKPSNAAKVNSYQPLLDRAKACAQERGHLPNIVAVDFYATGDLLRVVDELNGFPHP